MGIRSRLRSRAVISTPTLLPAVGVSPQVVYGTSILVAGYTGNCCRVVRASDSAQQDIGFVNGRINMAQAITFAGGSELTVTTWYDQTGNGNNATQSTLANQPRLRPQNAWNGVNCITFDGRRPTTSVLKSLTLPAGVTINRQSHTTFEVASAASSYNANAHYEIGDATTRQLLCTSSGFAGLALSLGSGATPNRRDNGRAPRLNPSVNATRGSASASRVSADTTTTDFAANTAGTSSGGLLGGSVIGSSFNGTLEMMAFVHYAGVLNDTEYTSVQNSLQAAYAINYSPNIVLVEVGDSLTEGTGSTFLQNRVRQTVNLLNTQVHVYNMGIHGTTAATFDTNKAAALGYVARAGARYIVHYNLGGNDLGAGATASTVWTALQSCVAYSKSINMIPILSTIIPRGDYDAAKETERQTLNTNIRNNATALGYILCDYTAAPEFDSQADASNTTFYDPDGVHLNNTGYGVQAAIEAPIVNAQIALLNEQPISLPNLALWLDASHTPTITHSSNNVLRWNDKSGQGNSATQGTLANQPVTNTRTINSRNALDFNVAEPRMLLPVSLTGDKPTTAFVVYLTDTTGTRRLLHGTNAGGTRVILQKTASFTQYMNRNDFTGTASSGSTPFDTNPHIAFARRDGVLKRVGSDGVFGTELSTAEDAVLTSFAVGSLAATDVMDGLIAEVLIYQRALTDTEINAIGQYLGTKWNIAWSPLS